MSTYSFKSVVGAFSDPDVGPYLFAGQEGVKQLTVSNTIDHTVLDTASDAAVMVSYVAGANGSLSIEMQQTSSLHQFLVNWANAKFTAADAGDALTYAAAAVKIQDLLSGASHILTGVAPTKVPDKSYGPQGATVTWVLLAAQVVTQ